MDMAITRVLVANRGEIARRVFATCRRLGLSTVAVYTDPDADAPHVAEADARVRLPHVNSYLDAGALIAPPVPTRCTQATDSSRRTPTSHRRSPTPA
jgi:acetyl/propionyl-CoA carboxylase alpha subunit